MIVYQYDAAGLYQGDSVADESPLEPGVWLMPARTTQVPPPDTVPQGQWPRWNGSNWQLINQPPRTTGHEPGALEKLQAFLAANPDVAELVAPPSSV